MRYVFRSTRRLNKPLVVSCGISNVEMFEAGLRSVFFFLLSMFFFFVSFCLQPAVGACLVSLRRFRSPSRHLLSVNSLR